MTLLTPNYADQRKSNGQAGPVHVMAAHEPTREGEAPVGPGVAAVAAHNPTTAAVPGPLKVALVGTAPSSRMLAPYGDPSWSIWGCSPGNMNSLPRVDAWFELHSNLLWPEHEAYGRPYIEWLKAQAFPVYMQDRSLVPRATPFPMLDVVREFGRDFFTSSFAWMMAYAMKIGAAEIALYGIDMASREEYILQRPGFYFFRHMAERRGIKVSAPHESDIMQSPPLYAYVDSTPLGRKIRARKTEVQARIAPLEQQANQATHNKTYLQGALEDIDYFESIWSGAMDEIVLIKAENAQLREENAALKMPQPGNIGHFIMSPTIMTTAGIAPMPQRRRRRKPASVPQPEETASPMESHDG